MYGVERDKSIICVVRFIVGFMVDWIRNYFVYYLIGLEWL